MKRLLLAMVLVLVIAIPAFAQNGPIRIKPLLAYTSDESNTVKPWFNVGEPINVVTMWEVKGTGSVKYRVEVLNSEGVLIDRIKLGPYAVNSPTFTSWTSSTALSPGVPYVAGYFTVKTVWVDVATGNTWSPQTKIHVSASD
jgi:hypothetical protein